ncbi:MAG: hypothetical protein IPJ06_05260 [Saprospiraceae bacterium]|nr:hypothetical protein [Saprospiraceae bacterium]
MDITVECDAVPVAEVVTAQDNCDLDVDVTYNEIKTDGSCPDSYTLTRTWIAIDNCGNATTHVQKVTVEDTTPPVFDNKPVDITVECDAVPVAEVVTAWTIVTWMSMSRTMRSRQMVHVRIHTH